MIIYVHVINRKSDLMIDMLTVLQVKTRQEHNKKTAKTR